MLKSLTGIFIFLTNSSNGKHVYELVLKEWPAVRHQPLHIIVILVSIFLLSACTDDEVASPLIGGTETIQPSIAPTAVPVDEIDPAFLEQFYGMWYSKQEQGIILNINEKNISVGYEQGDVITEQTYTIEQVNEANQFMVVTGKLEEIMLGEDGQSPQAAIFRARLTLQQDGFSLIYDNQYLGEQIISEWQRSAAEFDASSSDVIDENVDDTALNSDEATINEFNAYETTE